MGFCIVSYHCQLETKVDSDGTSLPVEAMNRQCHITAISWGHPDYFLILKLRTYSAGSTFTTGS